MTNVCPGRHRPSRRHWEGKEGGQTKGGKEKGGKGKEGKGREEDKRKSRSLSFCYKLITVYNAMFGFGYSTWSNPKRPMKRSNL